MHRWNIQRAAHRQTMHYAYDVIKCTGRALSREKVTAAVACAALATAYARIVHTSYACNAICMVRVLVRFRITSEKKIVPTHPWHDQKVSGATHFKGKKERNVHEEHERHKPHK